MTTSRITKCAVEFDHTYGAGTMATDSEQENAAQICEAAIEKAQPATIEDAIEIAEIALKKSEFSWMRQVHSVIVYPEY